MKKLLVSAASLALYGLPAVVMAEEPSFPSGSMGLNKFSTQTNLGKDLNLIETVANIINILLGFLGVLAVVLVLWGGFKWMTSAGEEAKIGEAKKLIGAGIVGLIIILAAYAITAFVVSELINATGYFGPN